MVEGKSDWHSTTSRKAQKSFGVAALQGSCDSSRECLVQVCHGLFAAVQTRPARAGCSGGAAKRNGAGGLGNMLPPAKRNGFGGKGTDNQMAASERCNRSMHYLNHQG